MAGVKPQGLVGHAAEAYLFEQTGKIVKTHRGVRSEFARLAKAEPRIDRELVTFLATAYQFKTLADYGIGAAAPPITAEEAASSIDMAGRFIDLIAELLPPDPPRASD